jgi:hypothetical protein
MIVPVKIPKIWCAGCLLLVFSSALRGAAPSGPGDDPLKTLRPSHPRVMLLPEDVARIKKLIADGQPDAVKLHDRLRAAAAHMLKEKPVEYKLIGPRLLDKSRTALKRITTLALLYQLDGDRAFADRAIAEMLDVAAFADWHPPHFLDTAEMTAAVSLGYDWLYDALTPDQRKTLREAIRDKGLNAGLAAYHAKKPPVWTVAHHNWAQVCGGGLTLGALAIGDEEPVICSDILQRSFKTFVGGMEALGPDGGCPEGPGYWDYATQYSVYCIAGLDSALGTDWGLSGMPGFADTGMYRIETTGPTGMPFNYADGGEGPVGSSPQLFWMARRYNRPAYAAFQRSNIRTASNPFDLLWLDTRGTFPSPETPTDSVFRAIDVATFRGSPTDPNTTYIGFKGGNNRANHAHLDLGTFVLDALGKRWANDLGSDDYNLPGYFGPKRWAYYRLRTEGHNTLLIDGENQVTTAVAPLVAYASEPDRALAVADLTAGYAPRANRALRGIELLDRRRVVVQDEIDAAKPVEVVWNFHTRATIAIEGEKATLTQGTATMIAQILSPAGAKFEVISANPPPPQKQQPDVHNLIVRLPGKVTSARIVVVLIPVAEGEKDAGMNAPKVESLSEWIARAKPQAAKNAFSN